MSAFLFAVKRSISQSPEASPVLWLHAGRGVLGPGGAILVIATVLLVQCLLFQDGESHCSRPISNLGLIGVGVGYSVFRLEPLEQPSAWNRRAASCQLVLSRGRFALARSTSGSGTVSLRVILPPMLFVHAGIGVGEAPITAAMLSFWSRCAPILSTRPIESPPPMMTKQRIWELVFAGLAVAIGISLLLTPFSSPLPDGLEALAQKLSFQDRARSFWPAPMASMPFRGARWNG